MPRGLTRPSPPYEVTAPAGVILPYLLTPGSVYQRFPSAPGVMRSGVDPGSVTYSVTAPAGVIFPILPTPFSVNHTFPSGPRVIPNGVAPADRTGNSVTAPVTAGLEAGTARMARTAAVTSVASR